MQLLQFQKFGKLMNETNPLIERIDAENLWSEKIILERNEYLQVAGNVDTTVYFVKSGSLRMYVVDEYDEHIIRFGYSGNLFVSLDSFLTEKPSNYYIQAIKKSELWGINKQRLKSLIDSSEKLKEIWNNILEQIIVQQLEREQDILTSSPLERYNRVLSRSPRLFQEIPNKHIASYLRMTPETLSRLKKP